jgi:hypothetical protein
MIHQLPLPDSSGAVVAAQEGRWAALADQARQDFDQTWRADTAIDVDRQSFLGELVGHR